MMTDTTIPVDDLTEAKLVPVIDDVEPTVQADWTPFNDEDAAWIAAHKDDIHNYITVPYVLGVLNSMAEGFEERAVKTKREIASLPKGGTEKARNNLRRARSVLDGKVAVFREDAYVLANYIKFVQDNLLSYDAAREEALAENAANDETNAEENADV